MRIAAEEGLAVDEADFDMAGLLDADEVMLTNSLMGLGRVLHLGEKTWPQPLVSPRLAGFLNA
jgi:branched-subunit amino acid aminotransferase/4-amino-4-deoxychorismate lyase